jgi:hypothetical protein
MRLENEQTSCKDLLQYRSLACNNTEYNNARNTATKSMISILTLEEGRQEDHQSLAEGKACQEGSPEDGSLEAGDQAFQGDHQKALEGVQRQEDPLSPRTRH